MTRVKSVKISSQISFYSLKRRFIGMTKNIRDLVVTVQIVILSMRTWGHDCKFTTHRSYIVRPCLKTKTAAKNIFSENKFEGNSDVYFLHKFVAGQFT
jgi:hypothetical protein